MSVWSGSKWIRGLRRSQCSVAHSQSRFATKCEGIRHVSDFYITVHCSEKLVNVYVGGGIEIVGNMNSVKIVVAVVWLRRLLSVSI